MMVQELNTVIIKSIFKKLNIDCLILSQKDSVEYEEEELGEFYNNNSWTSHKLRKKIFALKNDKITPIQLDNLKESVPEKIYNYILAESLVIKDSKKLLRSPREVLLEMWKNEKVLKISDFGITEQQDVTER